MSADTPSFPDFGKFVPGFDFLQNLTKQAAANSAQSTAQTPSLGNWVAPTLNVEDLDKRIQELKAVQFWLDQNAMALKATIQALEVQKMTLATLKGMNFNMGEMANAFKIKPADSTEPAPVAATGKGHTFSGLEIPPSTFQASKAAKEQEAAEEAAEPEAAEKPAPFQAKSPQAKAPDPARPASAPAAGGVVDPMQWWGALTQQFQTIAADAMKESGRKTSPSADHPNAGGLAQDAMKSATDMAKGMAESASATMKGGTQAIMNNALRSSQAWPTPRAAKSTASGKAAPVSSPKAAKARAPARKAAAPAGKTARKSTR